jgi:Fe2+ or Zn2+ uptake regulation protein
MKRHYYHEEILKICDNKHLTAEEIFEKLKKKYHQVGISTVYRNVEELTKQGKLKKITNIGKKAVFEKNK